MTKNLVILNIGNNFEYYIKNLDTNIININNCINNSVDKILNSKINAFDILMTKITANSPTALLSKGYWHIKKDNRPITNISQLNINDQIEIVSTNGQAKAIIKEVNYEI